MSVAGDGLSQGAEPSTGRPVLRAELGLMHGVAKTDRQICRERLSCIPYVAQLPLGDLKKRRKNLWLEESESICILGYF